MNDDELMRRLGDGLNAPVPEPSPDRIAAIRAAALRAQSEPSPAAEETAVRHVTTRRAMLMTAAAAAVGAVGGAVVADTRSDEPAAAPEPPTELLSFSASEAVVAASTVSGSTINHTWGVELLLDAIGFPVGSRYVVEYIGRDGAVVSAGGFVGSDVEIHCRCNGVLLRDEIAAIEIRDADDQLVSRADLA